MLSSNAKKKETGSVTLVLPAVFLFGDELIFVLCYLLLTGSLDRGGVPLIRMQREGGEQPLEIGALARRTPNRRVLRTHEPFELVATRTAVKVVNRHPEDLIPTRGDSALASELRLQQTAGTL
jgi:hypothetical protein